MASVGSDSCDLCLGPADKTKNCTKESVKHLWSYLYHRNVRESVQVGVGDGGSLPKLTFSLSLGGGAEEGNGGTMEVRGIICGDCCEELEKLDKLHRELEAVKKAVEDQVRKIDRRRKDGDTGRADDSNLTSCVPKLQMSMAGSVVGKHNIMQALQFLGSLTEGIPMIGTEPKEQGTPSHQQNGMQATAEEFHEDPPLVDTGMMKVEVEDIKISTILISNNQPEDFELDGISSQCSSARRAESAEGYLFLDHLPSTTIPDKEQDPLAGLLPPENVDEFSECHPLNRITGSPKSCKLNRKKPASSRISGSRKPENARRQDMKFHSDGATGFKCEICMKTISHQRNLGRHQRSHTDDPKPFSCDLCQKGFTRNLSLQYHKRRCQRR